MAVLLNVNFYFFCTGLQRSSKSHPRVLVERLDQDIFNSVVNRTSFSKNISSTHTDYEEDNLFSRFDDDSDGPAEESWNNDNK